jgi:ATPase subunit of ABC transporter with duplicated ATPase domains
MSEAAILTEGLSKSFGTQAAVAELNLKILPGAVYGFLGRNGAGKTTTMRMLLGLVRPTMDEAEDADFFEVDTLERLPRGNGHSCGRSHIPRGGHIGDTDKNREPSIADDCSLDDGDRRTANAGADNADDRVAAQREGWIDLYGWDSERVPDLSTTHHGSAAPVG